MIKHGNRLCYNVIMLGCYDFPICRSTAQHSHFSSIGDVLLVRWGRTLSPLGTYWSCDPMTMKNEGCYFFKIYL